MSRETARLPATSRPAQPEQDSDDRPCTTGRSPPGAGGSAGARLPWQQRQRVSSREGETSSCWARGGHPDSHAEGHVSSPPLLPPPPPARPWGQLLIALTRHVPRFKVATPSATFRSPPPRKRPVVCKPAVLFAVEFGARHPSRLALASDQRAAQPSPTAVDGGHAAPCACPHGRRRRTEAGVAGSGEALQGRDQEGCPPRRGLWPHGSAGPGRDGRWARSPGPGRPGQLLFLLEG